MIIDKIIEVKIAKYNIEHYKQFFDVQLKDLIKIDTEKHLQKNSNIKINVCCDICKIERYIKYQAYIKNKSSCIDYPIYTCDKCSHIKLKNTNIKKYGCEYYSQHPDRNDRVKTTSLEKFGTDHFSKSKEFKERVEKTNLEKFGFINPFMDKDRIKNIFKNKYGVDHPSQVPEFYNKAKKVNLKRYGYESILSSPEIRKKIEETNLERYGNKYPQKSEIFKSKMIEDNLEKYGYKSFFESNLFKIKSLNSNISKHGVDNIQKSEIFRINRFSISKDKNYIKYLNNEISLFKCANGHNFEINIDNYHSRVKNNITLCTVCYPINDSKSIKEKELLSYIKSIYSDNIVSSYRDGLEIDIFLPDLNIGFEFNGLYFHSNKFKDTDYHLSKTNFFKERGIRIIQIWEDDWIIRNDIIKSQISNLLKINTNKIFARKCYIKEIKDNKIVSSFLNMNHIQGKVNSSLKLGLYHNSELVSLMIFDHNEGRKRMLDTEWNLSRFCNLLNTSVIGGASKLLNHFIKNYDVDRIISYADKDWSIGNIYYTLGFSNISEGRPDYKYIIDNERVHKSRYKKSKLNTDLSESKEMNKRNILKIYDCGKIKFEYIKRAVN